MGASLRPFVVPILLAACATFWSASAYAQANTTTSVTSSANPIVSFQVVTFTATVSPVAPGTGTPTGTVTFIDGGSPIAIVPLSGGVATFTTARAAGNHTITASYGGDANFNGSTGSLTGNPQVVNQANTTTTVTSSANPDVFGQAITFTATVFPVAPSAGTPTGTVTFLDGGDTNFNGSTGSLTGNPQVVNQANTTTRVTSSANPDVFGQPVTLTATISPVAPGAGTPTGTVTFLDGGNPIGIGTLSGGVATFATAALAVGNHTLTTSYGGDGNFNGSTGSLTGNPQVVNKANTTTSVTSSANPDVFGQSITFTATVSPLAPGAGTPTGTVTFLDGGTPIGTGTLSGGVAAFPTSALAVGNHTITTIYGGDGNFNGSAGSLTGNPQVVNKANTTTAVTSSANPSAPGQSVTFTATVSPVAPGSGIPTGTVTFLDGGNSIGTGTLSGGVATFATSALSSSTHTITTSYGGDGNFNGSTGSLTGNPQTVNRANATTTVTSSVNPSVFGQSVTFTATVSPAGPGGGTPTGTVTFLDGGSTIGTGTLSGGVATFTTTLALAVGNHTITTSYGGDGNFNGGTGSLNGNPQVVNKANTTSTVTSSSNTINNGQSVTFTAMVSPTAPGTGTPTGTVSFVDTFTSATIGTGTLSGGVATFPTSALAVGNHTIKTSYAGDGNFNGSTSSGVTETVNPKPATTTTVASSANPSVVGQAVTFTATITPTGGGTATGTVTFLDGGSTIGTGTLSGNIATISTSALTAGSHTITTSYPGDGNFSGSTGSLAAAQVVAVKTTTTSVASSLNPSAAGQAVTFTATVTTTGGGGAPTGTVTFNDGDGTLGTGTLAGGIAIFTTSSLAVGSHSITAAFNGAASFGQSTSAVLTQAVGTPTDSVKLRALQVAVTKLESQGSGQAISGVIDGAIADGFEPSNNPISATDNGLHFNFTAEPKEQAGTAKDRVNGAFGALGYHSDQTVAKPPPFVEPKVWLAWADIHGSNWNTGLQTGDIRGGQTNATAGITRKLTPDLLVGAFGGYENFDYTSELLGGRLKGNGWTAGGYFGWRVRDGLRFDAGVARSGISYDGTAGTAVGSFPGARWLVTSGVTGIYKTRGFEIEPSARVYAIWENDGAFVDSLGTPQAARDFSSGRASTGAKATYPWLTLSGTLIAPYAGVFADYYFNQDDAALPTGTPLLPTQFVHGLSARVVSGVGVGLANGPRFTFGGELGGLGNDFKVWSLRGRAAVPF